MTNISEDAYDLLLTARKRAAKTGAGKIVTIELMAMWYSEDEDDEQWLQTVHPLITELLQAKLIGYLDKDDPDDGYILLPRGENYTRPTTHVPVTPTSVTNNFGDISHSNIANMSSHITQNLDLSSYSVEIQKEIAELQKAVKANDDTRAKRIIDGLWVSAPALVLSMIQIGLGVAGGVK